MSVLTMALHCHHAIAMVALHCQHTWALTFQKLAAGPTLQLDQGGGVNLKSRLDVTDGTTASGARRGVPIPIVSALEREMLACLRGYEELDPNRVRGRTLGVLELSLLGQQSQAFIKTRCLHEHLPMTPDDRRLAIQRIQHKSSVQGRAATPLDTPLDVALAMWKEAQCAVAMLVIDEVESLVLDDAIALGAFVAYQRLPARPGDPADGAGMAWLQSDDLTPSLAVALAVKAGAPIYLRREIYEDTICDLARLQDGDGTDGDWYNVCMFYIHIFIYTCIHMYIYLCIHMYIYLCIHIYIYMYTYIHVYICVCIHVYIYVYISSVFIHRSTSIYIISIYLCIYQ
jgi:hypothetical protein